MHPYLVLCLTPWTPATNSRSSLETMEATQTMTPGSKITLYRFRKDPMQFCTVSSILHFDFLRGTHIKIVSICEQTGRLIYVLWAEEYNVCRRLTDEGTSWTDTLR
jgi:hypothetical protein